MERQTIRSGFTASLAGWLGGCLLVACGGAGERAPGDPGISLDPSVIGQPELDGGGADGGGDAGDAAPGADAATDAGIVGVVADAGDGASGDDARAQESGDLLRERLLIADTSQPLLYAYDLQDCALLQTLSVAGDEQLVAGSTGRFAYLKQASQLRAVDMGLTQVETSKGVRYEPGPVQLLSASVAGAGPGAVHAQAGKLAIFFDGDGSLQLFEELTLLGTLNPLTIDAGEAHAGLGLPWAGKLLISTRQAGQSESQLQRFAASGQLETALACDAPTLAAANGVALTVGCAAGLLRFAAGETIPQSFPYSVPGSTVERLVAHPFEPSFLGLFHDQLCVLHSELVCAAAPAGLLELAFDPAGKRALALTRDGQLHVYEARSLLTQGSFAVTTAAAATASARELPDMAVGKRMLYVSDPATSRVHEIHVPTRSVQAELMLPGSPGQLLLLGYP